MNTIDVNPNRFLRHWLASAIGVWLVAGVACLIAWTPVAILTSVLAQYDSLTILARVISAIAFFTIPGLSIGYVLGDMQHNLMRDLLGWNFKPHWVRNSAIGGLFGGLSVIVGTLLLGAHLPERMQWMITLPLFMFPVSIMQWRILRTVADEAWMWILGNFVGALVFSGLFFSTQAMPFRNAEPLSSILLWLFAAASLGIITGVVMLWLYDRPVSDWDESDELARVYIEVRNREDR